MTDDALSTGLTWLDASERERCAAFHFARDRRIYLAAHALTRALLSACTGHRPAALSFETDGFGRPQLRPAGSMRPAFSLSHTAGLVACAAWHGNEVGIDVEGLSRPRDELLLAESFFAPSEARALKHMATAARAERFIATWTLKEAYAKARGLGLGLPFTDFEFADPQASRPQVRFLGIDDDPERWHFWSRRCGAGHRLALACAAGRRPVVHELTWELRASGEHAFA